MMAKGHILSCVFKQSSDLFNHPLILLLLPVAIMFLPMPTSIAAWVFRWTFSPPSPSHLLHFRQLRVVQCLENCPLLSGELSTKSRQSSDSYFSSVQSSQGPDIKLAQIWLTNKSQPNTLHRNGCSSINMHATELCEMSRWP